MERHRGGSILDSVLDCLAEKLSAFSRLRASSATEEGEMEIQLSEKNLVAPLLLAMIFQALVSVGLYAWGRWVARRQGRGRWWRLSCWLPLVGLALAAVGVALVSVYLVQGFGDLANVHPAEKAVVLARTISEAMNCTAFFASLSWVFYLGGVVVFTIGSVRRPRLPR